MPVHWSSTFFMLQNVLNLQEPITAHCASQRLDLSMKTIISSHEDWKTLKQLRDLFNIFVATSTQLQADNCPTLNHVVPSYLRMIVKHWERKHKVGKKLKPRRSL